MKVERLSQHERPAPHVRLRLKHMGTYDEARYSQFKAESHIERQDADHYIVKSTGELKEYQHNAETRADNVASVRQSMARLRDLIRTNVHHPSLCRWVTLTYAENMQDTEQLYGDFRKFNQRFQRYLRREHDTKAEYIAVAEPQGRGAWHLHVLYFFPSKAPFIPNKELAALWGHGFTKTKALKGGDDVAMYLTAYLTDMPLEEALKSGLRLSDVHGRDFKVTGENGHSKAYIKGARMRLYPAGMRLYRCSKGIRKPFITHMTEAEFQAEMEEIGSQLVYEKTIRLTAPRSEGDNRPDFTNTLNYRLYKKEVK